MSDQDANALNDGLGIQALIAMAESRGLHASLHEAEQAWSSVTVNANSSRLAASWAFLYKGYTAAFSPVRLLSNSQLPAWIVGDTCVGLLRKVASGDEPAQVEWLDGSVVPDDFELELALVPVAPLMEADETFLPKEEKGPATKAILEGLKAHKGIFWRIGVASTFINLIAVLSSLFVMQVYDRVVPNFAYATLWFLASGVGLAYLIDLMFKFARLKMMDASSKQLDEAISLYIFEKLLSLKLDRRPSRLGSLVAQVRDYESIKAFFSSTTLFALVDLPFIFLFIAVIYLIAGPVAIVLAVFALVCLLIGVISYKPTARLQQQNNDAIVRRQGMLYEAVAGGEVIKSQGGEGKFADAWLVATRETSDRAEALSGVTGTVQIVTSFFQQVSYVCMIIVGVYVIETGELTMGGLIACSILGGRALATIANISSVLLRWHHAKYSLAILNQLLSAESDDSPARQSNVKTEPLGLSMHDVVYAYPGSQLPELVVPGLEIPAGSRIAVLGRNGSGKSTLLKLLAAVATPSKGDVRVAHLDYQECRPSWLREVIGYLPQEPRLFSGSLLDNLTLGMSTPSEEVIFAALEKTGLADAVNAHPMGLQLQISEGGMGMSGGQRQLVGLTRMLLQQPKIWLLDEPTASLDSRVERKIAEAIQALPSDVTVIFTTHSQSWLRYAKRVMLLDEGQIKRDVSIEEFQKITEQAQRAKPKSNVVNVGGV
jgi:ATP-binding cassette subfamily C protein LapB